MADIDVTAYVIALPDRHDDGSETAVQKRHSCGRASGEKASSKQSLSWRMPAQGCASRGRRCTADRAGCGARHARCLRRGACCESHGCDRGVRLHRRSRPCRCGGVVQHPGHGRVLPGSPLSVIGMATAMESAKLVTAGWLGKRWRVTAWLWRLVLAGLIAGLAVIDAAGVSPQLVAAHVGDRGAVQSAIETQDAALAVRIEVAAHMVDDLDRRLRQIDTPSRRLPNAARPARPCRQSRVRGKSARRSLMSETRRRVHWRP